MGDTGGNDRCWKHKFQSGIVFFHVGYFLRESFKRRGNICDTSSSSSYFICRENNVKTILYSENGGLLRRTKLLIELVTHSKTNTLKLTLAYKQASIKWNKTTKNNMQTYITYTHIHTYAYIHTRCCCHQNMIY